MEDFISKLNDFSTIIKGFRISDALDILVTALLIYGVIKIARETRAAQLIKGILILMFAWLVSIILEMRVIGFLLSNFSSFGILALMILFQPELRRALEQIGRSNISSAWNELAPQAKTSGDSTIATNQCISCICDICNSFSQSKVGALIVFERLTKLGDVIATGTIIDAKISKTLFGNIFFNKAPLHDGAVIIRENLLHAAGCILPLTKNDSLNYSLGTRHRAALGVSEISDAVVIVVSEETGSISLVKNGIIKRDLSKTELKKALHKNLLPKNADKFKTITFLSSALKRGDKKHE